MLTFKQFITEKWSRGEENWDESSIHHDAKVGGHHVRVSFGKDHTGKETDIDFEVNHSFHKKKDSPVSPEILHHVHKVVKHFLSKRHRQGKFWLSPNSSEKKVVYQKYAKRLNKQIGGKLDIEHGVPSITLKKRT